jgi:hypothetical protein
MQRLRYCCEGHFKPSDSSFLLVTGVSVILMRHPSIVNTTADATCPDAGPSLVQWAIENGCSSSLLAKLLNAQCSLGLLRDSSGRTAISPAIEHGKSAHMQVRLQPPNIHSAPFVLRKAS